MLFHLSLIILIVVSIVECYVSYDNYKVYKVLPHTKEHVHILSELNKEYDFWSASIDIGKEARIMVPPSKDEEFKKYISDLGIQPILSISNVQE